MFSLRGCLYKAVYKLLPPSPLLSVAVFMRWPPTKLYTATIMTAVRLTHRA